MKVDSTLRTAYLYLKGCKGVDDDTARIILMHPQRLLHDDLLYLMRNAKEWRVPLFECLLRLEDYGETSPCAQINTVFSKSCKSPAIWSTLLNTL